MQHQPGAVGGPDSYVRYSALAGALPPDDRLNGRYEACLLGMGAGNLGQGFQTLGGAALDRAVGAEHEDGWSAETGRVGGCGGAPEQHQAEAVGDEASKCRDGG